MRTQKQGRIAAHSELGKKLDVVADAGLLPVLTARLEDERLRTVLQLRHGLALSWQNVFLEGQQAGLYFSERQMYRLYARALAELAASRGGGG